MSDDQTIDGLSISTWSAAFRPGIDEFAATTFVFTREGPNLVRIAFGNAGPHVVPGQGRRSVFTHAVTLPPETAVQLAGMLLKFFAQPDDQRSKTSAEI
jgi:hypothetical protein